MEPVIKTEKLTKRFGSFIATNEITFEVFPGEIFGFLGANGAGKTTAMRMLCGLSAPSSGKATVAGFDVYKQAGKIKANIGYMSQKFSLYEDLTVLENIRFFAGIYGLTNKQIKEKSEELNIRARFKGRSQKIGWIITTRLETKIIFFSCRTASPSHCVS